MEKYSLIVGNIGTVCESDSEPYIVRMFESYKEMSQKDYGRAAGESVILMDNHLESPHKEHIGSIDRDLTINKLLNQKDEQ